ALGNRRAQAVVDFFTGFGLDGSRFSIISYGEERPAAMGSNETAWAQNRRAEFVITAGQNDINPGQNP
ncbi:MAG: OmpA family protein, partial [Longimicrobiales bacterium]